MNDVVLLGDEALAQGALDAGLSAAFGYPGTPSTEILEYLIEKTKRSADGAAAQWCANEKTAYESALGASFAGKRTMVTMKHVGLNVAADPFMNSSLVGIKGGLIVVVADDPGMHSSQGEQDTRYYADFAMVPCFEPTTQQEAYEMVSDAFALSEAKRVPVVMRMVTRLAHSRAVVHPAEKPAERNGLSKADRMDWMLLPALARKNYEKMLDKQTELLQWAEASRWNTLKLNPARTDLAIVTCSLGRNYYLENLADYEAYCRAQFPGKGVPSVLHVGALPLPVESFQKLAQTASTILVIEEGMPFIEKKLKGLLPGTVNVVGKLSGRLPRSGELNPDVVRAALGLPANKTALDAVRAAGSAAAEFIDKLPGRPPQLCSGCPHADSYTSLNAAVRSLTEKSGKDNVVVAADIGCYALGAVPPFNAVETVVCMGASVGMARGAAVAGVRYAFGVIGDSTFLHSGITNLIDCVASKTPVTILLLDNSIVAMTGCQPTILPSSKLEGLIKGIGVEPEHIRVLAANPANREENAHIIEEEAEYRGVSVVIMVRECLEAFRLRTKAAKAAKAAAPCQKQ